METDKEHMHRIRGRYLLAAAFIALLVVALFGINIFVYFVITKYLPAFTSYIVYVTDASRIILALVGSYIVYRILISVAVIYGIRRHDKGTTEVIKIVLRILFYAVVISIILDAVGVSLSTALAGGAVGGIIIGLAVQTVVGNILSGFLVSSSKTILPGDIVVLHSGAWGDLLCKVKKVSIILTEVVTHDGNRVQVPNSALLTSTVYTKINTADGNCSYVFPVAMTADVPLNKYTQKVKDSLKKKFSKIKQKTPGIYVFSKTAGVNTFNVVMSFDNFDEINKLIDIVNTTFDEEYWSLKK
jgi:small-conductance mechanosensitive channel